MANSGKFVSVNLNKSYGQPPTSYSGPGRPRAAGGGMVVLTRPRSSGAAGPKGPPKLAVPPPLNLPSRRKEHEKLDPSAAVGSSARQGSAGVGSGGGTAAMGWTKPAAAPPARSPMPPGARPADAVGRAVLLRGEDFPSLGAATVTPVPKPKDSSKQKGLERAELLAPLDMRPQLRSARAPEKNASGGGAATPEQSQKQDGYFPGPLPLVRLSHKSDWADDERDTGLSIPERERGFSETSGSLSREVYRGDSFRRDIGGPSREGRDVSSWRTPLPRDGFDRGPTSFGGKESGYGHNAQDGFSYGVRRDVGSNPSAQNGRVVADGYNVRADNYNKWGRYDGDFSGGNRSRGDAFQNSKISRNAFSSGSKGFSLNDPILNFGKDKRLNSSNGKTFLDDGGLDSNDSFSGALFGEVNAIVLKKKKDALKEADFHDPARESFEAELERVQRMQEMERKRAMEEQNRAFELARREQEERERLIREEEERRRRLEEEAREAVWRAEQEKLEAARRAEAQKVAREEDKRRIFMEEERRKEAARKKLLELEARMAKRHGDGSVKDDKPSSSVTDERLPAPAKERDAQRATDIGEWEDGERMVERITSTASSEPSSMNRYIDTGSRPYSLRDGSSSFTERGKHANNWRRDAYDNGNNPMFFPQDLDNEYHSPRRDALGTNRGYPRTHGNLGPPGRPFSKVTMSEASQMPDDRYSRHRWNIADADYFNRNADIDANFPDNDKFGDAVWGPGHSRGSPHASYAERPYQNSEMDEFSTFGRSRNSLRQPRVLPPPSVSMSRSPFRAASEYPSSSSFLDTELSYQHSGKAEEASFDPAEMLQQPATTVSLALSSVPSEQNVDKNSLGCDSQSSLSVSSPPTSPTHLSQDDQDESEGFQAEPTSAIIEPTPQFCNDRIVSSLETEDTRILLPSSSLSHGEDDEWAAENHEMLQEQEEYDEDDDGYHEEEEAHDGNADNLDQGHGIENIQPEVVDTSGEVDQVVLGFDEGVQVNIPISDEFEQTSRETEIDVEVQTASVGAEHQQILSDGVGVENDSSKVIMETEKADQDLVLHPVVSTSADQDLVLHPVVSTSLTGLGEIGTLERSSPDSSSSSLIQPILSSVSTSSDQPVLSSVSTVATQPEVPFNLQFGLFSGPSLFPSPVPAIQIGSIRMPLHLHPQVGPSVMHSSASLLQFGQLRYTPLASQSVSFAQPSPAHYSFNQNLAFSAHNRESHESSSLSNSGKAPIDKQHNLVTKPSSASLNNMERRQMNSLPDLSRNEVGRHNQTGGSSFIEVRSRYGSVSQTDRHSVRDIAVKKKYRPVVNNFEPQFHAEHNPSQSFLGERTSSGSKTGGMVSGGRGKRFAYTVRNVGSRTSFSGPDVLHTDSTGFQRRPRRNIRRTEFRVRENADKSQAEATHQFQSAGQDGNTIFNSNVQTINLARYGGKKDAGVSKLTKSAVESENLDSCASSSGLAISDGKVDIVLRKDAPSKKRMPAVHDLYAGEGNMRTNGIPEEDVDAPLQSNIVRVFNQPGIEAVTDGDGFIQVRSKRQMLNDKREQREKEMKAMSRAVKVPRKTRPVQSNTVQSKSNRAASSLSRDTRGYGTRGYIHAGSGFTDGRGIASAESSPMFTARIAPQSLPPIGTPSPSVISKSKNPKSSQKSTAPTVSCGGTNFTPDLSCENNNRTFDIAAVPLVSWGNADLNQQVMALTQSQLDEAMQPARSDSLSSSSITHEPVKPSTSIMMPDNALSSSSSPLNSLLAGETIQFGAVTSPAILPPVSRAISSGYGPSASGMTPKLPTAVTDSTVLFEKEEQPAKSFVNVKDPEAEAEAAASAVAVAAISNNDEMVGNRSSACSVSVSVSETRNFNTSDAIILTSEGMSGSQVTGQSSAEDSLTVSLPADLSVDTPSIPLWPPLPSPHNSSGPMLSHFPAAPLSHFPCFEMNPMLGGAIFAFGPQDESAGTQTQPQISTTMGSRPLGGWPQCHPTIESFYGPPTGYTGPFISPPGGIPGVQGPPHMVVYNHFAPVGQYGQVGLSFMGTTYIPTGKQPDWKHNTVSSAVGAGETVVNNLNVVSDPRNPQNMATIQHLAPGSPLMQMGSPLTMFDMPPFQSSDVPVQARWSHISAPPLHSVPLSVPLQQHQVEGMHSQFGRSQPGDNSVGNNRFHDPRLATTADTNRSQPGPKNTSTQFPNELGVVGKPSNNNVDVKTSGPSGIPAGGSDNRGANNSKSSARAVASSNDTSGNGATISNSRGSTSKPQAHHQSSSSGQQYLHAAGHTDQRGSGASQKVTSGGEWHRRMGYQGRNQASGSSKVKQIYVAKSQSGNPPTG